MEASDNKDWWMNSKLRAHISKLYLDSKQSKYYVNTGYGGKKEYYYSERMVELPFLFRNIVPAGRSTQVLDIGCVESVVPIQLAMLGYKVTGIDIRSYHFMHDNFKFIKGDFNGHTFSKKFDIVVDISAIEHFGLYTFSNLRLDRDADAKAINKVYDLLKRNGQFIFTAPFGAHETIKNFERIYSQEDIDRLFSKFIIRKVQCFYLEKGKYIREISVKDAAKIRYKDGSYATVCISAFKR